MTKSQSSITGTTHTLPFDKLSPHEFERLCLWLVECEGYARAEHLGAAGGEQGRDIIAWCEGQLWVFQCKRVQRFGPQDALAEVEKVLALPEDQRPAGLIFLVPCDVSANTRQQARERCAGEMECRFWTGTEFDQKVKRHPDIVEEFFSQPSSDATAGESVLHIDSRGGDIAIGNSVIDKRSGGIYAGPGAEDYRTRETAETRNTPLRLVLSVVVAATLGLLSNIVAAYLQQRYDLVSNTDRFIIVLFVFLVALLVSIGLAMKPRDI